MKSLNLGLFFEGWNCIKMVRFEIWYFYIMLIGVLTLSPASDYIYIGWFLSLYTSPNDTKIKFTIFRINPYWQFQNIRPFRIFFLFWKNLSIFKPCAPKPFRIWGYFFLCAISHFAGYQINNQRSNLPILFKLQFGLLFQTVRLRQLSNFSYIFEENLYRSQYGSIYFVKETLHSI